MGRISFAATLMILAGPASAGFYDGNILDRVCSEATGSSGSVGGRDADTNLGICLGFIIGVTDTLLLVERDEHTFCLPEAIKLGQAVDVVKKHLRDHPEERHNTAALNAAMALNAAWPCQ